jgi:cold shock CspA family protein
MAKAASFSKRDNEKKKLSKRLEKQHKKEERKNNRGSSFEDMIAYVDENGMITDTPPEEGKKREEVDLESIAISTPKRDKSEEVPLVYEGRVEYFNASKGYGFIKDRASVNKYFFHKSSAPEGITEGDSVFFDLELGLKGINAVNVRPTK